jgi:hypothetical protein
MPAAEAGRAGGRSRRAARVALLAGAAPLRAAACSTWFLPPAPPLHATDLNGLALPDVCFNTTGSSQHVFIIGDWGGLLDQGRLQPADRRSKAFKEYHRAFLDGVDDQAQLLVAEQMKVRAPKSKPDYILNVGDNFYWGGINASCGSPTFSHNSGSDSQWVPIYEEIYTGEGLDYKQWLGILGNHDYGGWQFNMAWDQVIQYTWGGPQSTGRWVTPAQYWKAKVHYSDFSVDYLFVDSNVFNAWEPHYDMEHNMCGLDHNPQGATCGPMGPTSVYDCPNWFKKLWADQVEWMERHLRDSDATWQVVVTHFPPLFGKKEWTRLVKKHGIDLIVSGHRHMQEVHAPDEEANFLKPTTWVVSGGGGGITSEGTPTSTGEDDAYGFMDLELSKDAIVVEAISHSGLVRHRVKVQQVHPRPDYKEEEDDDDDGSLNDPGQLLAAAAGQDVRQKGGGVGGSAHHGHSAKAHTTGGHGSDQKESESLNVI